MACAVAELNNLAGATGSFALEAILPERGEASSDRGVHPSTRTGGLDIAPTRLSRTFESAYDPRRNNFDFLRFLFATLVIWSHGYPLSGRDKPDWFFATSGQIDGASLAVDAFFVLSGFLIAQSWCNHPRVRTFAQKRFLRIGPALALAAAFGAFVVGPLASNQPVYQYLTSGVPWYHLGGVLLNRYLFATDLFAHNPYPHALNGSLWTLRYEFACYAMVAALGTICAGHWRRAVLVVFALSWLAYAAVWGVRSIPEFSVWAAVPRFLTCFSAGMIFWEFRRLSPCNAVVAAAAAALAIVTFLKGGFHLTFPIAGGYLILYAAFSQKMRLQRFGRYGDFSYGLYVFAYPIQQAWVQVLGRGVPLGVLFALCFASTLILAILSWRFVEKPALALKDKRLGEYLRLKILRLKSQPRFA